MDQTFVLALGLGPTEWIVIIALVLLLFGARKLPELAHSMGSSIQSFKKGMREGAEGEAAARPREAERKNGDGHDDSANGHQH